MQNQEMKCENCDGIKNEFIYEEVVEKDVSKVSIKSDTPDTIAIAVMFVCVAIIAYLFKSEIFKLFNKKEGDENK